MPRHDFLALIHVLLAASWPLWFSADLQLLSLTDRLQAVLNTTAQLIFLIKVVGSQHTDASKTSLVESRNGSSSGWYTHAFAVHHRIISLKAYISSQMSLTAAIYSPSTVQRFSCYLLNDRLLALILFPLLNLRRGTNYQIYINEMDSSSIKFTISTRTLFINKKSSYVYLKWFQLKKALMLLHEAIWTLAEVVYFYTNDHADMLDWLSWKESLSFIANDLLRPKHSPADTDRSLPLWSDVNTRILILT